MQPLFAVHNNVSLLSVTIAPSTFLAALTLALVFLSLYLPRLPSLPRLFSFGRRRTGNDGQDVALQRRQPIAQDLDGDGYGGYGGFFNTRSWRNREPVAVDWRHRQLPPLPPPPFRPLLAERGYVEEYDEREEEELSGIFRKKKSSRSDRDRSSTKDSRERERREKEREKEKARLHLKQEKQDRKSSRLSPSKTRHGSRYTAASTATTAESADLIVHSSRRNNAGVYNPHSQSSDDSGDNGNEADNINISNDAAGWLSFGVLGRVSSRLRPIQQPPVDTQNEQNENKQTFGYQSTHSGFLETDSEGNGSMQDSASAGGYSPPAWRRLENGDRSSGFWRKSDNILGSPTLTTPINLTAEQLHRQQQQQQQYSSPHHSISPHDFTSRLQQLQRHKNQRPDRLFASRASSPGFDSEEDAMIDDVLGVDDDDVFDNYGGGYAEDTVLERAMRTRLPGSMSPEKDRSPEPELVYPSPLSRMDGMRLKAMESIQEERLGMEFLGGHQETSETYIRFAVRSEAQDRKKLIHSAVGFVRGKIYYVTQSWAHIFLSVVVGILSFAAMRTLSHSAGLRPVPDLVKVAGVARSFEPLIYYSENGVAQVHDLEATGVAVWDLGESVRLSNLTSAPIIVQELDDLSDTLKALAIELTRFFANIDGDIDGILIVMEWARRELARLQESPSSSSPSNLLMKPLTAVYDNVYNLLACAGLFENVVTGSPTAVGTVATSLFGMSGPQRTRATLHRTFHEFLVVLEEAVATELQHSLALFALFENIDRQFLNLVRTVAREASVQDERHADLLSGLWTRILGPSAAATAKYEQNRELLRNVREKTVRNKGVLVEHNHRLLALKTSLESLRRKLVSPLVRSVNSSTLTLDEQIHGLEDVREYLSEVRARQKGRLLEALYGAGSLRERIGWSGSSDDGETDYREAVRAPMDGSR